MIIYLQMIESDEDKSKFEIMYTEYKNLMLYVANQILRDTPDSEDVVHQSFLKLIGILDKIEEPKCHKTRALLVTIVERTAIDLYRKRQNHTTIELQDEYIGGHVLRTEAQMDLASAMASLPTRYREVLLLKYDSGFSTNEIAQLLSMTETNVRKTIQRAKEKLGNILEEGGIAYGHHG